MSNELVFEIIEQIGEISANPKTGWGKELNIVAWHSGTPKFDIREWDDVHERMSRGITLTKEEARKLRQLLNEYFEEENDETE